MEQFARISHIIIFTGVFQASAGDGTVRLKLSWFRQLCRRLYLIDALLVLLRHTRTVLFCVCKVSLQSFDIVPPKSLLFIIIIIILITVFAVLSLWQVGVATNLENREYSGISTNVENSGNSVQPRGKFLTNKIVTVWSNICITRQGLRLQMNEVSWILETVTVHWWPVILLELMWNDPWHMKVIITFTFCCDNLWKSIVCGSGKSLEDLGNYFSPTLWSPWQSQNVAQVHLFIWYCTRVTLI